MIKFLPQWFFILAAVILLTHCASINNHDQRWKQYEEVASHHEQRINPIIIIPGILGSKLIDTTTGKSVWGKYGVGAISFRTASGQRTLALPMERGKHLSLLTDDVASNGTLDRLRLTSFIGVNAYAQLLQALAIGGYRDQQKLQKQGEEHFTCFQFSYDWRRSNVENAAQLDTFIKEKTTYVKREYFRRYGIRKKVKFDIVAHSMAGLLARYYLMYGGEALPRDGSMPKVTWLGAQHVARLILVGSPNLGSVETVLEMKNGYRVAPLLPKFNAAVIGTYPSSYELLPDPKYLPVIDANGQVLDIFDPAVWEAHQWGLADPKQSAVIAQLLPGVSDPSKRQAIALDHQQKCLNSARRFRNALNASSDLPSGLEVHAFIGESIPTPSALVVSSSGKLRVSKRDSGDGTVTKNSSLLLKLRHGIYPWNSIHPIPSSHIKLTGTPLFIDELLHLLLKMTNLNHS